MGPGAPDGGAEADEDVTTADLMRLAAHGGSFDFLADDREDLYSPADGEPIE